MDRGMRSSDVTANGLADYSMQPEHSDREMVKLKESLLTPKSEQ